MQQTVGRVLEVPVHFNEQQAFAPQIEQLLEQVGLSAYEWQSAKMLLVLPSLNWIAAMLLAALHGRMGYFPTIVRLRAVENEVPRRFEIAEIIDLQQMRADNRSRP